MHCPKEQKLLAAFAAAALAHLEAVDTLCHLVRTGSKQECENATLRAEHTASKCKAAHLNLEKHRLEHNCRDWARGVLRPTSRLVQQAE